MFDDKLFRLISLIDCDQIPLAIFTRASIRLSEWNAEGELVERSPLQSMVPVWFQLIFQAADFHDGLKLRSRMSSIFDPPCILVQSSVADTYISMDEKAREDIRSAIPDASQSTILFEILSLMIHGFPEREAEIDYRMEEQYLPVFESTCLPFLLKVKFEDILHYCSGSNSNSSSPSTQINFLLSTWNFLRRAERSRLKVLPNRVHHLELQIGNYLSMRKAEVDVLNLQYLKVSRSITNTLLSSSSGWCIDNVKQHQNYNQPRINAMIGSVILEVWQNALAVENAWNPTIWMPLKNDCWSSYERLVLAISRRQYSPSTNLKLSVSTEVLIAFKMSNYGQFAVAQEILLRCVPEVQKEHGSFSAEFVISGTELVLCFNAMLHPELGLQWAERIHALTSPFLEFQYPSLEINLRMAKIDAEIGQGRYKTAMEKLQSLLSLENLPSSIVLKASLRLLKSYRRQGDVLPNLNIWGIYENALRHAHLVSSLLFHEFLLEAISIFSHVRSQVRSQVRRCQMPDIIQARMMLKDTILLTERIKDRLVEGIPETTLTYYIHAMQKYVVTLEAPSLKTSLVNMKGIHSTEEDCEAESWDRASQQESLFPPSLETPTDALKTSLNNEKGMHPTAEDFQAKLRDIAFQQEPLFFPGFEKLTETTRDVYRDYFKTIESERPLLYNSDSKKEVGNEVEYPRQKSVNRFVLPEKPVTRSARRSRSHAANTRVQPTTDPLNKGDIYYKHHQDNELIALEKIYEDYFNPVQTLKSIGATPDGHPNRASWPNNLGLQLSIRYEKTGAFADLEKIIQVLRQAVDATPEDDPDHARWLNNLGLWLGNRYEKTGATADLEESIQVLRQAIATTPEDNPYHASRLNNLGIYLGQRYRKAGVIADLEEAIYLSQRAVDTTPEDSPYHAGRQHSLEALLFKRSREAKARAYLEEGILMT